MIRFFVLSIFLLLHIVCKAGLFDELKTIPVDNRVAAADKIYNDQVKHQKDSAVAINSIQELIALSKQLDDKMLQCFAMSTLADYYARIRKYNDYSVQLHNAAIKFAEKSKLPPAIGAANFRLGRYYYYAQQYPLAFEYLLRANNIFNEIGYEKVQQNGDVLFFLSNIYYETGNYEKAEFYFKLTLQQKNLKGFIQTQSLNTLAMMYKRQNDTARALQYFKKTLDFAAGQNDTLWIAICEGNIAGLYFDQQQYDKSYPLLMKGHVVALARKEWSTAYIDMLLLAQIDLLRNDIASAKKRIDSVIVVQKIFSTMVGRKNLYETQYLFYQKINQPLLALEVQNKLIAVKDSINIKTDKKAFADVQLRLEIEKHLNAVAKLEDEAKSATLKRNLVIVILILTMFITLLVYNRLRQKRKTEQILHQKQEALLQSEKLRAEEELNNAQQLLNSYTENIRQKNELIEQVSAELEMLKTTTPVEQLHPEKLEYFDKLVQSTILTADDWDNFRLLFDKVHKGFFFKLKNVLPNLSESDTRLISLIKLQLSNREMANMLGVSIDAIKKAKQRLRKKITSPNETKELEDIVVSI